LQKTWNSGALKGKKSGERTSQTGRELFSVLIESLYDKDEVYGRDRNIVYLLSLAKV